VSARARRAFVLATLAVCAFLVSGFPVSLHGAGIAPVLVLAVLDLALIRATRGLAFARARSLDERQSALRDLAYRRGFRLLGLAMVITLAAAYVGAYLRVLLVIRSNGMLSQVDSGIGGRFLVGVLELLVMMPTMVIAWMEPDPPGDTPEVTARPAALLAVPAIAAAWLLVVAWAPAQRAAPSPNMSVVGGWPGSACRHFAGGRIVGAEFGATVGMRVHVCWNGRRAFVVGDPSVPAPGAAQIDPLANPLLTACGADNSDDFAVVSDTTCAAATDLNGTLHYAVHGRVSPLPFSIGEREVGMSLVVTRDGRVLEKP